MPTNEIVRVWDEASQAYIEYDITPEDTVEVPILPVDVTTIQRPVEVSQISNDIMISNEVNGVIVGQESNPIMVSHETNGVMVSKELSDINVSNSNNVIEVTQSGVGANGVSAYQTWLSLGNSGTEQQFLDHLATGGITIDSIIDSSSTNPVQNQAVSSALDEKVDDDQVLTDVPVDALFTDTTYLVEDGGLSQKNFTTNKDTKLAALPTNGSLTTLLANKEGTISDLSTIRSGAANGATALQGLSSKVGTEDGKGLIIDPPTADGTYSYKVEGDTKTWTTTSSGGGISHYQAFRTVNGTTLQWDDNVTSIPASLADGWAIIDGLTSDTFSVTNDILQRGT